VVIVMSPLVTAAGLTMPVMLQLLLGVPNCSPS